MNAYAPFSFILSQKECTPAIAMDNISTPERRWGSISSHLSSFRVSPPSIAPMNTPSGFKIVSICFNVCGEQINDWSHSPPRGPV